MNPYQGLKLASLEKMAPYRTCSNQHESLSGIETNLEAYLQRELIVLINMNPYQGLKQ